MPHVTDEIPAPVTCFFVSSVEMKSPCKDKRDRADGLLEETDRKENKKKEEEQSCIC